MESMNGLDLHFTCIEVEDAKSNIQLKTDTLKS